VGSRVVSKRGRPGASMCCNGVHSCIKRRMSSSKRRRRPSGKWRRGVQWPGSGRTWKSASPSRFLSRPPPGPGDRLCAARGIDGRRSAVRGAGSQSVKHFRSCEALPSPGAARGAGLQKQQVDRARRRAVSLSSLVRCTASPRTKLRTISPSWGQKTVTTVEEQFSVITVQQGRSVYQCHLYIYTDG
jgi:hypothetical protein